VDTTSGDSHWVFESSDPNVRTVTATDKRFFWLSLYVTPALWVGLAILAIVRLVSVIWLSLIGEFQYIGMDEHWILTAFSYCLDPDNHQHHGFLSL
jgi:hypothetical protein